MSLISLYFAILFAVCFSPSSADRRSVSCVDIEDRTWVDCEDPLDSITELSKTIYIANVPCINCPYYGYLDGLSFSSNDSVGIVHAKNDLIFNISLSLDRTELLVNHKSIFPALSRSSFTIPPKPRLVHVSPDFARSNLNATIECIEGDEMNSHGEYAYIMCFGPRFSLVDIDYDYSASKTSEKDGVVHWEVTFDAIGGTNSETHEPYWAFNGTGQNMVKIFLKGKDMDHKENQRDPVSGATPFGDWAGGHNVKYALEILKVELVDRAYTFPDPPAQTFWSKFAHFFGSDPKPPQNHIVYHQIEWDTYGKYGTLRNAFGAVIYETKWAEIFIVVGCVLAGVVGLYGLYRLCLLIVEQRRLAQWGGIDEVWRQMRAAGIEENLGLLDDGRYRDYPGDSQSPPPSYTDEVQVNKPLPSKPLPDKPLPAVPLIEDV